MHLLNLKVKALIFKCNPLLSHFEGAPRQSMHHAMVCAARRRLLPIRLLGLRLTNVDVAKDITRIVAPSTTTARESIPIRSWRGE